MKFLYFLFAFLLVLPRLVFCAGENSVPHQEAASLEEPSKGPIEFEGNLRLDNDINPDQNGTTRENLRTQRFELQANTRLLKSLPLNSAKDLHFILRTKMERTFVSNGVSSSSHLNATDYVKEAYLQLNEVGAIPLQVLLGASEVSYGQDYRGTLDFQNDAAHAMTDPDNGQIKGITLAYEKNLLGVVDKIESTFFSPDPDIKRARLNHLDGFSARISKKISKEFDVQSSLLRKGNGYDPTLTPETKVSIGGVFTSSPWNAWGEAVKMTNFHTYPNGRFGATTGVSRLLGPVQLSLEFTSIQKTLDQYGIGCQLFFTRNWTFGSTYRYTSCVGGDDGCISTRGFGQGSSLDMAIRFGFGGEENENPSWIGKD